MVLDLIHLMGGGGVGSYHQLWCTASTGIFKKLVLLQFT